MRVRWCLQLAALTCVLGATAAQTLSTLRAIQENERSAAFYEQLRQIGTSSADPKEWLAAEEERNRLYAARLSELHWAYTIQGLLSLVGWSCVFVAGLGFIFVRNWLVNKHPVVVGLPPAVQQRYGLGLRGGTAAVGAGTTPGERGA